MAKTLAEFNQFMEAEIESNVTDYLFDLLDTIAQEIVDQRPHKRAGEKPPP